LPGRLPGIFSFRTDGVMGGNQRSPSHLPNARLPADGRPGTPVAPPTNDLPVPPALTALARLLVDIACTAEMVDHSEAGRASAGAGVDSSRAIGYRSTAGLDHG